MKFDLRASVALFAAGAMALSGCGGGSKKSDKSATTAPVASAASSGPVGGAVVAYARMGAARAGHTATAIPQGVLVVGGEANGQPLASAELYAGGAWTPAGQLATARSGHSATLLSSGLVLVAGGQRDAAGNQLLDTTEVFDPSTGAFRAGPRMGAARSGHVAVPFATQQGEFVLFAGGLVNGSSSPSAEIYDVRRNQFAPAAAPMLADRLDPRAVLLASGQILIQGGLTGITPQGMAVAAAGAELFDPATQAFAQAGKLGIDRAGNGLARTDDGLVLAIGGDSTARNEATIEAFDPKAGDWKPVTAVLAQARARATTTALSSGDLLVVGGADQAPLASIERIVPRPTALDARVEALAALNEARQDHTATLLANGNVLVVGGRGALAEVGTSEEYDPNAPLGTPSVTVATGAPVAPIGPVVPQPAGPTAPPPQILAIYPTKGKPGDLITIAGRNMGPKKQDNQVAFAPGVFGKVWYEVQVKNLPVLGSVQTLVVEVPNGAQSGDVAVITGSQPSNPKRFEIDLTSAPAPQVLYTLPRKADVNGFVTIFGRNFARPASDNVVRFAGTQAAPIGGITTQSVPFLGNLAVMLVRVPQGAVTGDLTVEAYGKTSRGYAFEVKGTTPAPAGGSTTGSTTGGSTTGGSTPPAPPAGARTYFSEDFEGAALKFTHQGGLWEATQVGGSWIAGTAVSRGSYAAGARGFLISSEIDLTQATTAELTFRHSLDTDGKDAGRVIVSPDGGATYYLVRPAQGYASTPVFNPGEGFTGATTGWTNATIDLSQFAGRRITVVFDFAADGADQRKGWQLDDVRVSGF